MGKDKVVNHHRDVPYRVLERVPEKGVLDSRGSDCGNMVIHGDNLEALKALLPEYEGRVDCIYIDPPYNTGNEGWAGSGRTRPAWASATAWCSITTQSPGRARTRSTSSGLRC